VLKDDPDMKPQDGVVAVKRLYGLEMSTGNFSAYNSQIRAKEREGGPAKGKGKGGRPKKVEAAPTSAVGGNRLEAAKAVKALVDKYGAEQVKGLADLFAKGQGQTIRAGTRCSPGHCLAGGRASLVLCR
jgi:hypothetical protein